MSDRMIIGESERAGLPMSAPVSREQIIRTSVRWKHNGDSFSLEFWNDCERRWIEVPVVGSA